MPYVSQAQEGYFHTHKSQLEKQGVNVSEWDAATKGKHLPQRVQDLAQAKSLLKQAGYDNSLTVTLNCSAATGAADVQASQVFAEQAKASFALRSWRMAFMNSKVMSE